MSASPAVSADFEALAMQGVKALLANVSDTSSAGTAFKLVKTDEKLQLSIYRGAAVGRKCEDL
jgi:hypothetical protein